MKPSNLNRYGEQIKRITKEKEREETRKVIRQSRFKASLVDDPLAPSPDLARAIETSRNNARKS